MSSSVVNNTLWLSVTGLNYIAEGKDPQRAVRQELFFLRISSWEQLTHTSHGQTGPLPKGYFPPKASNLPPFSEISN